MKWYNSLTYRLVGMIAGMFLVTGGFVAFNILGIDRLERGDSVELFLAVQLAYAVFLVVGGGYLLVLSTRAIARPLKSMTSVARRLVGDGDTSAGFEYDAPDEIGQLAAGCGR